MRLVRPGAGRQAAALLAIGLFVFLGAAFAAPPAAKAPGKSRLPVIDTAGPVEVSKCAPCHSDLNAFDNPNLKFKHQAHFERGIRCQVCHVVFPHQPSGTIKPTMDLCVTCHRLSHGTQGKTAPGNCDFCHPPGFQLRPAGHTAEFAGAGHKTEAGQDMQRCLVCHDGQFCETCHSGAGIAPASADTYRFYPLWPEPQAKGRKITIGQEPVGMASCEPCHRDLGRWKNDKLVNFKHSPHLKRQIGCPSCHDKWPHRRGSIEKPRMTACTGCHRLNHGNQGPPAPGQCQLCHPPTMALRPDFHTADFIAGAHKFRAKQDRGECRMCHGQEFCDRCHRTAIPHEPGWRSEHGGVANSPDALDGQGQLICLRCHVPPQGSAFGTPSCADAKCHKAQVFPHTEPWAPQHGKLAREVGREVCATCHLTKVFCDKCHGNVDIPHADNWIGRHRIFLQTNSINLCLTCHSKGQCIQCHATHKVHTMKELFDYSEFKRR